jgi:transcriptional regulator with XRE-family HTH domain
MRQGDLSRLESGRHDPRLSTLLKLAAALDLQVALVPKEMGQDTFMAPLPDDTSTGEQTPRERYAIDDEDE